MQKVMGHIQLEQLINIVQIQVSLRNYNWFNMLLDCLLVWTSNYDTTSSAKRKELAIISLITSIIGMVMLVAGTKLSLSAVILATFAPTIIAIYYQKLAKEKYLAVKHLICWRQTRYLYGLQINRSYY